MHPKRIPPKPGQESVWDYPRPPRLEKVSKHIRIKVGDIWLVDTNQAYRVLETSHPPVYYFPQSDIQLAFLKPIERTSFCEFKGMAVYLDIKMGERYIPQAAWAYPNPTAGFEPIKDYVAFYPSKMDACYVNDELVQAQKGDFYGGWITQDIVGPFKGGAGTWGW